MEEIRQLRRESLKQLEKMIRANMTKTLLLSQGIYKEQGIWNFREGYHYYAYLIDQVKVGGLMAFSPNRRLYMSVEETQLFKKVDFLKLINRYDPLSIKADEHTAMMMCQWLEQIKRYHRIEKLKLMRRRFTSEIVEEHVYKGLQEGMEWLSYNQVGPNVLSFVRETEQHFNKEMSMQLDFSSSLSRRIDQGDYMILTIEGQPVAQGAIEFESDDFLVLGNIYVKPLYRGKGYGEIVVRALLEVAQYKHKIPYLFVSSDNANAISLYEKLGFDTLRAYQNIHLTHIPLSKSVY